MKYFSMFTGIGGFELGIHRIIPQAKCIGFSEIDKDAIRIYQQEFFKHKNYGNARKVKTEEIQEFDLLTAGFPCQTFSIAGKRTGFRDSRGTLFAEIARILKEKHPRHFLLENVKGLLSHDNGYTFKAIVSTLANLGYITEWQVLNSKNFGVPQNRERVFIIGHLTEECSRTIFPIQSSVRKNPLQTKIKQIVGERSWDRIYDIEGITPTIKANGGGRGAKSGLYMIKSGTKKGYVLAKDGNVIGYGMPGAKNRRGQVPKTGEIHTLMTRMEQGLLTNNRIRRLTPKECERLQGFPDNWTQCWHKKMSDNVRYKMLGNAVTVNVIEYLIQQLKFCLT